MVFLINDLIKTSKEIPKLSKRRNHIIKKEKEESSGSSSDSNSTPASRKKRKTTVTPSSSSSSDSDSDSSSSDSSDEDSSIPEPEQEIQTETLPTSFLVETPIRVPNGGPTQEIKEKLILFKSNLPSGWDARVKYLEEREEIPIDNKIYDGITISSRNSPYYFSIKEIDDPFHPAFGQKGVFSD